MGSFSQLTYHIVFGTKYRKPIITSGCREELYRYMGGVIRDKDGCSVEIGGVDGHVHVLARLSAVHAVAAVVRELKANSSKWMSEKFTRSFEWQKGYGAFTVSFDRTESVTDYIRNQEKHHEYKKNGFTHLVHRLLPN